MSINIQLYCDLRGRIVALKKESINIKKERANIRKIQNTINKIENEMNKELELIVHQFKITRSEAQQLIDENDGSAYEDLGRKVCIIWSESFKPPIQASEAFKPPMHTTEVFKHPILNNHDDDDELILLTQADPNTFMVNTMSS
jgi:hypothetical protein